MGRYVRARSGNGRFRQHSLERDFGLRALWCASCGGGNPIGLNEPRPETCRHCGVPFVDISEKSTDKPAKE